MTKESEIVGTFIYLTKKLRKEQKMTIEQLADLANVHRTTIGLLERGERTPTLQVAHQIASALGFPISELLQDAELINKGKTNADEIVASHINRKPKSNNLRNEDKLLSIIGIDGKTLLNAIHACYQALDTMELIGKGSLPRSGSIAIYCKD